MGGGRLEIEEDPSLVPHERKSFSMDTSRVAVMRSKKASVIGTLAPTTYVPHTYDPERKYRPRLMPQICQRTL